MPISWSHPLWTITVKFLTAHGFEGISPLWSPLPGKVIKRSSSASPKTLSPRFNSAPGYREAELLASTPPCTLTIVLSLAGDLASEPVLEPKASQAGYSSEGCWKGCPLPAPDTQAGLPGSPACIQSNFSPLHLKQSRARPSWICSVQLQDLSWFLQEGTCPLNRFYMLGNY